MNKDTITIKELEFLMKEYGLIIRAIPHKVTRIYEKEEIKNFPKGKIEYIERFKKEMLLVEKELSLGGKFLIVQAYNQDRIVHFVNKPFDSIAEAVDKYIEKM